MANPWFTIVGMILVGMSAAEAPGSVDEFVTARDGHFYRGNERVRFWGVNVVDEPGRTRAEISHIAKRIRRLGFNAVRMHLYDIRLIDPNRDDTRHFATYRKGDDSAIDKFDYAVYCFKREGLSLYMTFDRARVGFKPGDYDILPDSGDRDEWCAGVAEAKTGWGAKMLWYIDERLAALHREYAANFLNHVNQYTGLRYADEPAIAIYEISNENRFVESMLTGGWDDIPQYFRNKLQGLWNQWLRAKYGGQAGLLAAWGELSEGESLADGTIRLAPTYEQADDYPEARGSDMLAFILERFNRTNDQFVASVRRLGRGIAVAPICHDTFFEPRLHWHYGASRGDFMCGGMYYDGVTQDKSDPRYPWLSGLTSPPRLYNLDTCTVADKPFVIYETNIHRPAKYRAEFPMRLATYGCWQDWDGIFFYVWSDGVIKRIATDEDYLKWPLEYRGTGYQWHGIVFCNDEVLLSQMRLAGEVFKNGLIRPAPQPTVFTFGKDQLSDMAWHYYGGYGSRYDFMHSTSFARGARIRFDPDGPSRTDGPVVKELTGSSLRPSSEILWDWGHGRLVLDAPGVKAALGFLGGGASFGDTTLRGVKPEYVCFAVASTDGQPLPQCHEAVMSLVSTSDNTGFTFDPEKMQNATSNPVGHAVVTWGTLPIQVVRPESEISLPWAQGMTATRLDFALRELSREIVKGPLGISSSEPVFYLLLKRLPRLRQLAANPAAEATTPGAKGETSPAPSIEVIAVNTCEVDRYGKFEVTANVHAKIQNPYDFDEVNLQGHFTSPSGREIVVDGFYKEPHRIKYLRGEEHCIPYGEPCWQVRFTPVEVGQYRWHLELRLNGETVFATEPDGFQCRPSDLPGFVRVSRAPYYLQYDSGEPFYGIGVGAHIWRSTNACMLYDMYLNQLAAFGGNYLSVNFETLEGGAFNLEVAGRLGTYDQVGAARFDYVIARAERRGIKILGCLNQTALGTRKNWPQNKYNVQNGGPCENAIEYFTSPQARRLQKRRLRYTVARWGYSPAILGWELWNEVNYTLAAQKQPQVVRDWHREMSEYLHAIDPNGHLVTTSFGSGIGCEDPQIWAIPTIDAVITHEYGSDLAFDLHYRALHKRLYPKPCIGGETGLKFPAADDLFEIDPEGTGLHNSLWACLVGGMTANTLTWWMDRYVQPLDLFYHYRSLSRFVQDIPFTTEGFKPFEAAAYMPEAHGPRRRNLVLNTSKEMDTKPLFSGLLAIRNYRLKRFIKSDYGGEDIWLDDQLPGILFGADQTERLQSLSMRVPTEKRTRIRFVLSAVSTKGARMQIQVDGRTVATRDLPDRDGLDDPQAIEFHETISIPLAPDRPECTVTWRNVGDGWVVVDKVVLSNLVPSTYQDGVRVWGIRGKGMTVLWVQNAENIMFHGPPLGQLKEYNGLTIPLKGMPSGRYSVQWWDTWKGQPLLTRTVDCDGELLLRPPAFRRDVAAKIRRIR